MLSCDTNHLPANFDNCAGDGISCGVLDQAVLLFIGVKRLDLSVNRANRRWSKFQIDAEPGCQLQQSVVAIHCALLNCVCAVLGLRGLLAQQLEHQLGIEGRQERLGARADAVVAMIARIKAYG